MATNPADMNDDDLSALIHQLEQERETRKTRALIANQLQARAQELYDANATILNKPWVGPQAADGTHVEGCRDCIHIPLTYGTDTDAAHHQDDGADHGHGEA
ncbi:MAG: hypothetical protein ACTH9H_13400 [Galactobacter sp.]